MLEKQAISVIFMRQKIVNLGKDQLKIELTNMSKSTGVVVVNSNVQHIGTIISTNNEVSKMTSLKLSEIVNKNVTILIPRIITLEQHNAAIFKMISEKNTTSFILRHQTMPVSMKDGSLAPI